MKHISDKTFNCNFIFKEYVMNGHTHPRSPWKSEDCLGIKFSRSLKPKKEENNKILEIKLNFKSFPYINLINCMTSRLFLHKSNI